MLLNFPLRYRCLRRWYFVPCAKDPGCLAWVLGFRCIDELHMHQALLPTACCSVGTAAIMPLRRRHVRLQRPVNFCGMHHTNAVLAVPHPSMPHINAVVHAASLPCLLLICSAAAGARSYRRLAFRLAPAPPSAQHPSPPPHTPSSTTSTKPCPTAGEQSHMSLPPFPMLKLSGACSPLAALVC